MKNILKKIKNIFKKISPQIVKIIKDNIVLAIIIVLVIVAVIIMSIYSIYFKGGAKAGGKILTPQLAAQKSIDYINTNILKGQGTVSLKDTPQEISGLYKITITFVEQKQDTDAYVTKDGKYLFPVIQGIPIDLDEKPVVKNPTDESLEENQGATISPDELKKFISCLKKSNFVIYGANWCGWTKKLVAMLGGSDMVKPIYIECVENEKLCKEKKIEGYPTILIKGKEYRGQRTFADFAKTTGCKIPSGAEDIPQDTTDGGC